MIQEQPKIALVSLGCPKNLVDSERILADLSLDGFVPTPSYDHADVILVNTCGFIDGAKKESVETLVEISALKKASANGNGGPVVVATGCLVQRYGEDLRREIPEIDAFVGPGEYGRLRELVRALLREKPDAAPLLVEGRDTAPLGGPRLLLTPRHYAYLRLSEGCDNPCTFCSIPGIRGRYRSRPEAEILEEAARLARDGAKELVLIGQDTTEYGLDLTGRRTLGDLIRRLDEVAEGVEWIRLLYAYPAHLDDDVLVAIAGGKRTAKYIDVPTQHASSHVLRRMGRRMTRESTAALFRRIREIVPGIAIRTTILVGSPGEREEDHQGLLEFLREMRFERLGAFQFSLEEGTPAARMDSSVDPETTLRRHREVMLLQQEIAFEANAREVGTVRRVLVDEVDPEHPTVHISRTEHDAPGIDRVVRLRVGRGKRTPPGTFVDARITGTKGYDLLACPA
ncbi:MAG: 30S ribosomal protein S12 methylthiotransferase RimO [Planctomycetes bacterium]|nr:30S ribosomal protein S12 methylthiotransferase RimO [Planctomycetota bacterium]